MTSFEALFQAMENHWEESGKTPEEISQALADRRICCEFNQFGKLTIYEYVQKGNFTENKCEKLSELSWYGFYKRGYPVASQWDISHKAESASIAIDDMTRQLEKLYDSPHVRIIPGQEYFISLYYRQLDELKAAINRIRFAFYRDNPEYSEEFPEFLKKEFSDELPDHLAE